MSDTDKALVLDLIRNDILTLEDEHAGSQFTLRYRPAPILKESLRTQPRTEGIDTPVLEALNFCTAMMVSLTADGHPVPTARAVMTVRTYTLLLLLMPQITAHATAWLNAGIAPGGELARRAERRGQA